MIDVCGPTRCAATDIDSDAFPAQVAGRRAATDIDNDVLFDVLEQRRRLQNARSAAAKVAILSCRSRSTALGCVKHECRRIFEAAGNENPYGRAA